MKKVLFIAFSFTFITFTLTFAKGPFRISSTAFSYGDDIPTKYAYKYVKGGKNISIPLKIVNTPDGTKSYAVIMWDKHKIANQWVHWLIINLPPTVITMPEGASDSEDLPEGAKELINSFGKKGYGGPGPPKGSGRHTYLITVYALNVGSLKIKGKLTRKQFLKAIKGKVISKRTLKGYYER